MTKTQRVIAFVMVALISIMVLGMAVLTLRVGFAWIYNT